MGGYYYRDEKKFVKKYFDCISIEYLIENLNMYWIKV